jgi:hypothetical protein
LCFAKNRNLDVFLDLVCGKRDKIPVDGHDMQQFVWEHACEQLWAMVVVMLVYGLL